MALAKGEIINLEVCRWTK